MRLPMGLDYMYDSKKSSEVSLLYLYWILYRNIELYDYVRNIVSIQAASTFSTQLGPQEADFYIKEILCCNVKCEGNQNVCDWMGSWSSSATLQSLGPSFWRLTKQREERGIFSPILVLQHPGTGVQHRGAIFLRTAKCYKPKRET